MKTVLLVLLLLAALVSSAQAQTTQTVSAAISWVDNSTGETGFRIERATAPNLTTFTQVGQVPTGAINFKDVIAGDTGGIQRCYRVQAFNATLTSAFSNTACATSPVISTLPAPSALTVTLTVTVP